MKGFFQKNDIAKAIGAMIILAVVLTWTIPYGYFSGSAYYEYGMQRVGLTDLTTLGYYGAYFAIDKVIFLLVVGGFYGLLSKVAAYQKITTSIAKKLKGKEILSLVITSVLVAILTSISTTSFAVILFVPFLISVILKMKLDKTSAFVATFGSIIIGILGATFGTDGLYGFVDYYAANIGTDILGATIILRAAVLIVSLVLFNFFTVLHAKKVLAKKNFNETKEDRMQVEDNTNKKVKVLPLAIVLGTVCLLVLLGIINWSAGFGVEVFNNFHTWLTELTIGKETTIFAYILGNSAVAFGAWDLFTICTLLLVASIIIAIISKINFSEYLSSIGDGFIKISKPVLIIVGVYAVFIAVYMSPVIATITTKLLPVSETPSINIDYNGDGVAHFNVDTDDDLVADFNLINQDVDNDGKCDLNCDINNDGYPDQYLDFNGDGKVSKDDEALLADEVVASTINLDTDGDGIADVNITTEFSLPKTIIAAFITNLFHVDLGYTGYAVGSYLVAGFGVVALNVMFLIYVLLYGFIQLFAPTSAILMAGLAYANIEYKTWLKYIWKFLVGILVCLLVLFIVLALV